MNIMHFLQLLMALFSVASFSSSSLWCCSAFSSHSSYHPVRPVQRTPIRNNNDDNDNTAKRMGTRSRTTTMGHRHQSSSALALSTRMAATAMTHSTTTPLIRTLGAGFALLFSSVMGMQIEQRLLPNSSILVTLVAAAVLRTVPVFSAYIPLSHPLYDLCFTVFLPSSLTLLLLAYQSPAAAAAVAAGCEDEEEDAVTNKRKNSVDMDMDMEQSAHNTSHTSSSNSTILACIRRIAVPFVITAGSSVLGCWCSYHCARYWTWFGASASVTACAHCPAALTAGLMAASYVGGMINFVATGVLLQAPTDLIGALATSDLLTMSLYFSFLSWSLDWQYLVAKFTTTTIPAASTTTTTTTPSPSLPVEVGKDPTAQSPTETKTTTSSSLSSLKKPLTTKILFKKLSAIYAMSVPVLLLTFSIVHVANMLERVVYNRFHLPGTACAVIAIVTPLINTYCLQNKNTNTNTNTNTNRNNSIQLFLQRQQRWWKKKKPTNNREHNNSHRQAAAKNRNTESASVSFGQVATGWSELFFLVFFASIGIEANLSAAVSMGPACILFSSLALLIHVVGTTVGCLSWNQVLVLLIKLTTKTTTKDSSLSPSSLSSWLVELEDVWIASNAAIGGPATAAAFCNRMKQRNPSKLQGRTIAATVYGVLGYAIGTFIGVAVYTRLL